MKTISKCNKCNGTGWIETSKNTFMACDCVKQEITKNQFKRTGLNLENSNQNFTTFETWNESSKFAKTIAVKYLKNFDGIKNDRKNSIIFSGQVGSGKTHLSIALALNLLKKSKNVVYMPYRDSIIDIKQNMMDKEYYKKQLSKFQTADVLLLDDLFKGKITDSDINIVFEIINFRYLNHLPLIVSSEFKVNNLLDFDEAIGSRIYEMSKDYIVEIKKDISNNYRLKN